MRNYIVLLVTLACTIAGAADLKITSDELSDLTRLADQVQGRFPPRSYYYVGVGPNPFLLIAILGILHPRSTAYLPILESDVRDSPAYVPTERRAKIKRQIERWLPTYQERRGRRLLLIEFAPLGYELQSLQNYITKLVPIEKGPVTLGLGYEASQFGSIEPDHMIVVPELRQFFEMTVQKFDMFRPFDNTIWAQTLDDEQALAKPEPNMLYRRLTRRLRIALATRRGICRLVFSKEPKESDLIRGQRKR